MDSTSSMLLSEVHSSETTEQYEHQQALSTYKKHGSVAHVEILEKNM